MDASSGEYTHVGTLAAQLERLQAYGAHRRGGADFRPLFQPADSAVRTTCRAGQCGAAAERYCEECGGAFCHAHCYLRLVGGALHSVRCGQCADLLDPPPDERADSSAIVVFELTPELLERLCPCERHGAATSIQALARRYLARIQRRATPPANEAPAAAADLRGADHGSRHSESLENGETSMVGRTCDNDAMTPLPAGAAPWEFAAQKATPPISHMH